VDLAGRKQAHHHRMKGQTMTTSIRMEHLKASALEACECHGHTMYPWYHYDAGNAVSRCVQCGREVQVLEAPKPNEADIAGPAVAMNC